MKKGAGVSAVVLVALVLFGTEVAGRKRFPDLNVALRVWNRTDTPVRILSVVIFTRVKGISSKEEMWFNRERELGPGEVYEFPLRISEGKSKAVKFVLHCGDNESGFTLLNISSPLISWVPADRPKPRTRYVVEGVTEVSHELVNGACGRGEKPCPDYMIGREKWDWGGDR